MLISPIMLIPKAIPFANVQQAYLKASAKMNLRFGPRLTARMAKGEHSIPISKQDYTPHTVLIAPPIIFQTRRSQSTTCPFNYSSTFIQQQHSRMVSSKCVSPWKCPNSVLERPELTVSCVGMQQVEGEAFGINASDFEGSVGYADFLFSITDNPFLYRGGEVKSTSDFIDSATETAKIILIFFTQA
jgi:hypothetical protein